MNYNYGELESLFEKIKDLLEFVNDNKLTNKNYFLYLASLASGEKIEYTLTKESIPHLLGIDTTYLISTGLYSSKNSYYVFTEMLEDPYRLYNLAKEGKVNYNILFSKHIDKKLSCFKSNININPHEIQCVSIYMKERTYTTGETSENFDYVIIKKNSDENIGLLCLAKNNEGIYVPMSSQILENKEEINNSFEKILTNQEITILTGIHARDFSTYKSYITLDEQISRIIELQKYKEKYNTSIDVSNNFLYYINKLKDNREIFAQSEETSKYIEQSQELEKVKKEIEELRKYKTELEKRVTKLNEENSSLKTQVDESQKREKQILKILKPEN